MPSQHPFEREVLADPVLVDAELGAPQRVVVVAMIPGGDRSLVAVGVQSFCQAIQLVPHLPGERWHELLVELGDALRIARHLDLHGVVRPRRMAQQDRHAAPKIERLVQQRPVGRHRLVPVLVEQLTAQVAVLCLLQERVHLRVVEADPIGAVPLARRETLDVGVGQAGELLAGDVDPVAVLVQVALEGDLDLHEAGAQALELRALVGAELVAGPAEVSQPVLQEPGALALQGTCLIGVGEGADRFVQVGAEDDSHPPLVESLLGVVAGVSDGGIGVDLAHEGAAAVCPDQLQRRPAREAAACRRRWGSRHSKRRG